MLQIRMIKKRVKHIACNYNFLIEACGKKGYTKICILMNVPLKLLISVKGGN